MNDNKYESPKGFDFIIHKFPKFQKYITDITYPGITLSTLTYGTRFKPIDIEGNDITFDDITVTFLVDSNFENYQEIFNWIVAAGFPQSNQQFIEYMNQSQKETSIPSNNSIYSDASLIHLSNKNNPVMETKFYDMFPVSLSQIQYSQNVADIDYIKANVNLKYQHYEIKKIG